MFFGFWFSVLVLGFVSVTVSGEGFRFQSGFVVGFQFQVTISGYSIRFHVPASV